jgi:hypothetical protein
MVRKCLYFIEERLQQLPRVILLAVAVLIMREPQIQGTFLDWGWYLRLPIEFVLVLLASLAVATVVKLVRSHGDEGPADEAPAARSAGAPRG